MARRIVTFRIDSHDRIGERLRVDGRLSRTGIQEYSDGDEIIREYRSPEEVFHPDSLASLRAMPVTISHPKGLVTGDTWRNVAVGHVGDDVKQDGDHVSASLWLHDSKAIRKVIDGELQELSVGYTAKLDSTPGEVDGQKFDARQTEIRGNHVALLPTGQARGGPSVRLRLDSWGDKMKFKVNGIVFDLDDKVVEAIEAERSDSESLLATVEKERDKELARADSLEKKVEDQNVELDKYREDEKIRTIGYLRDQAKKLGYKAGDSESPQDIRRKSLEKLGIKLDGKSDQYVEFRFEHELEQKTPLDKIQKTLNDSKPEKNAFSLDRIGR